MELQAPGKEEGRVLSLDDKNQLKASFPATWPCLGGKGLYLFGFIKLLQKEKTVISPPDPKASARSILLRRNVCAQPNTILSSSVLQVIEQSVSTWGPLWQQLCLPASASASALALQPDLPLCSSGKQLSLELGASQPACCSARCFSTERRPLGPKPPMPCEKLLTLGQEELSQVKKSRVIQVVLSCGSTSLRLFITLHTFL